MCTAEARWAKSCVVIEGVGGRRDLNGLKIIIKGVRGRSITSMFMYMHVMV
jgi:hypothetical protein